MTPYEFEKKKKLLREDSREYQALIKQFEDLKERETRESVYKHKAINKILDLFQPMRGLNRSKLSHYETQQLIEIGKATKALYEALQYHRDNKQDRYYSE